MVRRLLADAAHSDTLEAEARALLEEIDDDEESARRRRDPYGEGAVY